MAISQSELTYALLHRTCLLLMWVVFVVANTVIAVLFLLLAWAYNIDSHAVLIQIQTMAQSLHIEETWQMLAFWGLSGTTILAAYAWCWRAIYWPLATKYMFKNIEARNEKT